MKILRIDEVDLSYEDCDRVIFLHYPGCDGEPIEIKKHVAADLMEFLKVFLITQT